MAVLVVSYSREDQRQVRGIVTLLRGAIKEIKRAVYWDDDLEPGEDWFEQLEAAIDEAHQLFVMWCYHASTSEQVRREFECALKRHKTVVPVLLDSTPLCAELAAIHAIGLRDSVYHGPERNPFPPAGMSEPDEDLVSRNSGSRQNSRAGHPG